MPILSNPSMAFPTALVYVTLGILMDIWTIVTMVFFPPESTWGKFWLAGFLVTGFALLAIGLFIGQLGRSARNAELPPTEVTPQVTNAEQAAAEHPPTVIAGGTGTQAVTPSAATHGTPVMPRP